VAGKCDGTGFDIQHNSGIKRGWSSFPSFKVGAGLVLGSFRPIDDIGRAVWKSGGNGSGGGFDVVPRVFASSKGQMSGKPKEMGTFFRIGHIVSIIVIVGLPDAAVKESRDRVMTALINSGFAFTFGRTTINIAPADVKKEGPSFDLPIALGMIAASEQMESDRLDHFVMVGELALTGSVRPVKGVLPIALRAREQGKLGIFVPPENAPEAAVVGPYDSSSVQFVPQAIF
jgi:Mg-chelatase subunit ChlI-like protein